MMNILITVKDVKEADLFTSRTGKGSRGGFIIPERDVSSLPYSFFSMLIMQQF
jgi:hypothetical protein